MQRKVALYFPKGMEKPYGEPILAKTGDPEIDSLVRDAWGYSKPLYPDKLAYKLRQGHPIWMNTYGMPLDQLPTMDKRVPLEMYFPHESEFWAISARNGGNRQVRRTGGKKQEGVETYFLLYVDIGGRLPLFGSSVSEVLSQRYTDRSIPPPRSAELKEMIESTADNPSRYELQFLGYSGDARYWHPPNYLSWLLFPFSPNRKIAGISKHIDFEGIMGDSMYTCMIPEPSTLDLEESVTSYHQFLLVPKGSVQ